MKNDLVQMASGKARACLCVVSLTATTAENEAVISCHEGTEVSVGASAPVATGVDAEAGLGVGVECFDKLTLPEGEVVLFSEAMIYINYFPQKAPRPLHTPLLF